MEQRVSLITLGVANVAASRAFYDRLGWAAALVVDEEVAFYQVGGMVLSLYRLADFTREFGIDRPTQSPGTIALAHNVRHQAEVDAVLASARAAGGRILRPGEHRPWGGYSGYFLDPDGHPWEVAWNPGFPLQDDGSLVVPT
ncbi:MAG: VOC family protein [Chloroflexi bacterium]|nr:VOC family protein [Chloroflexota bacterium]